MRINSKSGVVNIWLILGLVLFLIVIEVGLGNFFIYNKNSQPIMQTADSQNKQSVDQFSTEIKNEENNKIAPIKVIYPNGGEIFEAGRTYKIKWSGGINLNSSTTVVFSLLGENGVLDISKGNLPQFALNNGEFDWTIQNIDPGKYRLGVSCNGNSNTNKYCDFTAFNFFDESDNWFTIVNTNVSPASYPMLNWNTYQNKDYGFSFNYPSDIVFYNPFINRTIPPPVVFGGMNSGIFYRMLGSSTGKKGIGVGMTIALPDDSPENEMINAEVKFVKQMASVRETNVGGYPALNTKEDMSDVSDTDGGVYHSVTVGLYVFRNDKTYILDCSQSGKVEESNECDQIISTFKFVNATSTSPTIPDPTSRG